MIVGANTLVNKDLEPDAVYAGIPAKKICSFDEFLKKEITKIIVLRPTIRRLRKVKYKMLGMLLMRSILCNRFLHKDNA